jgi:hypothetical protein
MPRRAPMRQGRFSKKESRWLKFGAAAVCPGGDKAAPGPFPALRAPRVPRAVPGARLELSTGQSTGRFAPIRPVQQEHRVSSAGVAAKWLPDPRARGCAHTAPPNLSPATTMMGAAGIAVPVAPGGAGAPRDQARSCAGPAGFFGARLLELLGVTGLAPSGSATASAASAASASTRCRSLVQDDWISSISLRALTARALLRLARASSSRVSAASSSPATA